MLHLKAHLWRVVREVPGELQDRREDATLIPRKQSQEHAHWKL